ncbi:MAG: ribonuclease P protein component [Patescibacteria group bacterium]
MLSQKYHISKADFHKFTKPDKILQSNCLTARVFRSTTLKKAKFSISVSKKIEKRAVLRNKMKRLAYDTIRRHGESFSKPFFIHFIFNTKPADLEVIPPEITKLLEKI